MGKEIEPRPKRWPRSIGSMMIAEEYGPPPTVKFSTGLSWSTILKMAVLRWLCFELYEKYLRAWDETRKNARKAIAAVIIIAAVVETWCSCSAITSVVPEVRGSMWNTWPASSTTSWGRYSMMYIGLAAVLTSVVLFAAILRVAYMMRNRRRA